VVSLVRGIVDQRPDLHDIELAVLTECFRVTFDIDNLTNKLGVDAEFDSLQQTALQYYRKLFGVGGIYQTASYWCQAGNGELVRVAPRGNTAKVSLGHLTTQAIPTVNALRSRIALKVFRDLRRDTVTQGGSEQQMPPQAAFIRFGFPD